MILRAGYSSDNKTVKKVRRNISDILDNNLIQNRDVGYSFNSENFEDDMYYSAGLGMQYRKITWDIMYKRNNSSRENSEYYKGKFDYDRISLTSGYIFDF